jgi:tRNA-specific 2-thiouridylase
MERGVGLPTAEKKDSQGICFLGKVTLDEFLRAYIPPKRGLVLNVAGQKIGEHNGAHFYTIGQRQGIGNIKHQKGNTIHKPVYVAAKDISQNIVIVADGSEHPALYRQEVELVDVNFVKPDPAGNIRTNGSTKVLARVRYRQPLVEARLYRPETSNTQFETHRLVFSHPIKFVAPGQSAVFYTEGGEMLGGGVIK